MSIHSTLTGTDLHESKGAAAASANTVAVADGLGSAQWKAVPVAALDTSAFFNFNKVTFYGQIEAESVSLFTQCYIYVPIACTVTNIAAVWWSQGTATVITTPLNIQFTNTGVGIMGSVNFLANPIPEGNVQTTSVSANNNVVAGNTINIQNTAGALSSFTPAFATRAIIYVAIQATLT